MNISIIRLGHGNETYPHGTRIRLVCEDGFVLSNPNRTTIKCAKGRWKPELPDCIPGKGIDFQSKVSKINSGFPNYVAASCITPTVPNAQFRFYRKQIQSGQLVKHGGQIELVCDEGYQQPPPIINVTLRCGYGSWDARASEVCLPQSCQLPYIDNGHYLDKVDEPGQTVDHETLIQYRCAPTFRVATEEFPRCFLGKIVPDAPLCIEDIFKVDSINATVTPVYVTLNNSVESHIPASVNNATSSMNRCRSPQKIENALLYFDQLFNSKLTLIGVAQLNPTEHGSNQTSFPQMNTHMPYQYVHGTEIMFRCVSNARQGLDDQSEFNRRSTWIIRCEDGNWIGRSFECRRFI